MVDTLIVLRLVVACVFLVAVAGKLRLPRRFAEQLTVYVRGSARTRQGLAWSVIAVELLLAVSYGLGTYPAATTGAGLLTTGVFALLVGRRLRRGDGGPCLCFGSSDADTIGPRTLVRLGLLAAAQVVLAGALVAGSAGGDPEGWSWAAVPADPSRALVWAIAATSAAAWVFRSTELAELLGVFAPRAAGAPADQDPETGSTPPASGLFV
jgi:hypothetical protein